MKVTSDARCAKKYLVVSMGGLSNPVKYAQTSILLRIATVHMDLIVNLMFIVELAGTILPTQEKLNRFNIIVSFCAFAFFLFFFVCFPINRQSCPF